MSRQEIDTLRSEFLTLKSEFQQRISSLESRIDVLLKQPTSTSTDDTPFPVENKSGVNIAAKTASQPVISKTASQNIWLSGPEPVHKKSEPSKSVSKKQVVHPRKVARFSIITLIEFILGPFGGLLSETLKLYRHYKTQGKAPIFFMTATGIIAMLLGFGYLMQYSFNNFLGEAGKIGIGFLLSSVVVILGVQLARKNKRMQEYASGLIGLGVLLNYLCAYFATDYYQLIGASLGFVILAVITLAAYALAHFFETKIVAVITLFGGATTPLFLNQSDALSTLYYAYLLLLSVSSLRLAHSVKWPSLAQLAMLLSVAMIEKELFGGSVNLINNPLFISLLHGFFYAYGFYCLLQLNRPEQPAEKKTVITVASNIALFIFALYQTVDVTETLASLYCINGLVFSILFFINPVKKWLGELHTDAQRSVLALYSSSLMGFAALILLSTQLLGVIWAFEGLILVYTGYRFSIRFVRIEGYIAYLIGLVIGLQALWLWLATAMPLSIPLDMVTGSGTGLDIALAFSADWISLMILGAVIYTLLFLSRKYCTKAEVFDRRISYFNNELFSVWITAAFFITLAMLAPDMLLLAAPIPLFVQLYRAQYYKLPLTEWLGMALYALLVLQILLSGDAVDSYRFSHQNWVGKLARIEAFLCLWCIAEFYRRYFPKGQFAAVSDKLRQLFFLLIPLLLLPLVLRRMEEWLPVVIWGSMIASLLLHHRFQYRSLLIEVYCLAFTSVLLTVAGCLANHLNIWDGFGLMALIAGVSIFSLLIFYWQGLSRVKTEQDKQRHKNYGKLMTLGLYFYGVALFIVIFGLTASHSVSLLAALGYYLSWYYFWPIKQPLRQKPLAFFYLAFVLLGGWSLIEWITLIVSKHHYSNLSPLLLLAGYATLGYFVYQQQPVSRLLKRAFGNKTVQLWVYQLMLPVAYCLAIVAWLENTAGLAISLALVVQATLLLISTTKIHLQAQLRISMGFYGLAAVKLLLFDMVAYSLVEKIMAFMAIGIILLLAAYFYQRTKPTEMVLNN